MMMVVGKKVKSLIIIVLWGLAIITLGFTLLQVFNPGKNTINKEVYSSRITSNMDYKVRLEHTPIYNAAIDAAPSKYYVVPFTDYITLDCSYTVDGTSPADVETSSYITAFLVSYIEDDGEEVILWQKEYTLAQLETTKANGALVEGKQSVKVELDKYMDLINQVEEVYDYRTNYYLMLMYTTEFNVVSSETAETRVLQPYLRLDIEDILFGVEDNSIADTSIKVTKQEQVLGAIAWDRVIIGATLFVIFALAAILLPARMQGRLPLSEEAKAIRQITMKYGDRIVNIRTKPVLSDDTVMVETIEDVMKIADEIAQPIFCVAIDRETYYYVNNNGVIYYISLKTE